MPVKTMRSITNGPTPTTISAKRGLAQAEREMHMLAELGCMAVAAPPFGNVATVSEWALQRIRAAPTGRQPSHAAP